MRRHGRAAVKRRRLVATLLLESSNRLKYPWLYERFNDDLRCRCVDAPVKRGRKRRR